MHERRIVRVAAAAAYALIAVIALACGGSGDAGGTAVRAAGPPPAEATPPPEVSVGVGWDTAPLIRDYGFGVPYQLVGFACAKGLPPKATVLVKVSGSAGARPSLGVEVANDGTVAVPIPLLRPGEVVWEFQSITLKDGSSFGMLPPGASATVGGADKPCQF